MNIEEWKDMESVLAERMRVRAGALSEHAEHFAHQQMAEMVEDGRAYQMSDDEERLIKAYRSFVAKHRPGDVFSWRSPEGDGKLVMPADVVFVQDPSDVSEATELLGG